MHWWAVSRDSDWSRGSLAANPGWSTVAAAAAGVPPQWAAPGGCPPGVAGLGGLLLPLHSWASSQNRFLPRDNNPCGEKALTQAETSHLGGR